MPYYIYIYIFQFILIVTRMYSFIICSVMYKTLVPRARLKLMKFQLHLISYLISIIFSEKDTFSDSLLPSLEKKNTIKHIKKVNNITNFTYTLTVFGVCNYSVQKHARLCILHPCCRFRLMQGKIYF